MWGLETIIRMNSRVNRGGIRLVCMTLVLKRPALEARYPGGLSGFMMRFPRAKTDGPLVAVHAMSTGEIGEVMEHLAGVGYDLAHDSAVGDVFAGPLEECPGIAFYQARPGQWYAVAQSGGTI